MAMILNNKNSRRVAEIVDTSKKITTQTRQSAQKGQKPRASPNRSKPSKSKTTGNAIGIKYAKMVSNPFDSMPVKAGFGTLGRTCIGAVYYRKAITLNSTTNEMLIWLNGQAALRPTSLTAGNAFSAALASYINYGEFASGVPVATTFNQLAPANRTGITNAATAIRVLASGVRAIVTCPATAGSGFVGLRRFTGMLSNVNLDSMTPETIQGYPDTDMAATTGGSLIASINWLPMDTADFTFVAGPNNNSTYSAQGIVLTSFIPGSGVRVFIETVTWLEYEIGTLSAVNESDEIQSQESLSSAFPSIENAWNYLKGSIRSVSRVQEFLTGSNPFVNIAMNYLYPVRQDFGAGHPNQVLIEEVDDDVLQFKRKKKPISEVELEHKGPPSSPHVIQEDLNEISEDITELLKDDYEQIPLNSLNSLKIQFNKLKDDLCLLTKNKSSLGLNRSHF